MSLMTRVESERRRRGWNQTTLGYHAKLSQGDISLIERRRLIPTPTLAKRLARALGIPPDALLEEVTTRDSHGVPAPAA